MEFCLVVAILTLLANEEKLLGQPLPKETVKLHRGEIG